MTFVFIKSSKSHNSQLLEKTTKDPFTNLYNKNSAKILINRTISSFPTGNQHAFFIIDIDNFKSINDTYGHGAGDEVILRLANIFLSNFRTQDIPCRIGGDEFVILMTNIGNIEEVKNKAKLVIKEFMEVIKELNYIKNVTLSIGIAITPQNGVTFEELYKHADVALYSRKNYGKNGFNFYNKKTIYCQSARS